MKAKEAARYCGMSLSQFHLAVANGEYPVGKKATGGTYWLRRDLEAAMNGAEATGHNFSQRI